MPLVSILIPVYNGSDFLDQAIDSALAQTYSNVEVIVVDDGSNDKGATVAIAESYGDNIRVVHKENGGVASALNEGIRQMRGDYFSWLSHDDLYEPGKIEEQIAFLEHSEDRNVVVYSDYVFVDEDLGFIESVHHLGFPPAQSLFHLATTNTINGCTLLIPKAAFDQVGLFDESLASTQDYDMWLRLCRSYPFYHQGKELVLSRVHENQGSRNMSGHDADVDKYFDKSFSMLTPEMLLSTFETDDLANKLDIQLMQCATRGSVRDYSRTLRLSKATLSQMLPSKQAHFARLAKGLLLRYLPQSAIDGLLRARNFVRRIKGPSKLDFAEIYHQNSWGGQESRSGRGSSAQQTAEVRVVLSSLVKELDVKSLLDLPCGDFAWMQTVGLSGAKYVGGDVVAPLIQLNQKRYGSASRVFRHLDLLKDPLPEADLLFCRDCLVHLNNQDIAVAIKNIKASRIQYLLTTTFPTRDNNELYDIWRPINLEAAPFNFPSPLRIYNEKCTEGSGAYMDKSLGLWEISSL